MRLKTIGYLTLVIYLVFFLQSTMPSRAWSYFLDGGRIAVEETAKTASVLAGVEGDLTRWRLTLDDFWQNIASYVPAAADI